MEQSKKEFIAEKISVAHKIIEALENMQNGMSESQAIKKADISKSTFRYFLFNKNLGKRYTRNAREVMLDFESGEERFYKALIKSSYAPTTVINMQLPSNLDEIVDLLLREENEEHRKLLHLRYWENYTLADIGKQENKSRQCVEQQISSTLRRIRRRHKEMFFGAVYGKQEEQVAKPISNTVDKDELVFYDGEISVRMTNLFIESGLGERKQGAIYVPMEKFNYITMVNLTNTPKIGTRTALDFSNTVALKYGITIPYSKKKYDILNLREPIPNYVKS